MFYNQGNNLSRPNPAICIYGSSLKDWQRVLTIADITDQAEQFLKIQPCFCRWPPFELKYAIVSSEIIFFSLKLTILLVSTEQVVESLEVGPAVKVLVFLRQDLPHTLDVIDDNGWSGSHHNLENVAIFLAQVSEGSVGDLQLFR